MRDRRLDGLWNSGSLRNFARRLRAHAPATGSSHQGEPASARRNAVDAFTGTQPEQNSRLYVSLDEITRREPFAGACRPHCARKQAFTGAGSAVAAAVPVVAAAAAAAPGAAQSQPGALPSSAGFAQAAFQEDPSRCA